MKLLFDQNISFRLISKISHIFPEARQVRQLGIENDLDIDIWYYAKQHSYTICTFDSDFYDLSNLKGHPPKIIWLRIGNTSTNFLADIIINKKDAIQDFLTMDEYSEIACLEIK